MCIYFSTTKTKLTKPMIGYKVVSLVKNSKKYKSAFRPSWRMAQATCGGYRNKNNSSGTILNYQLNRRTIAPKISPGIYLYDSYQQASKSLWGNRTIIKVEIPAGAVIHQGSDVTITCGKAFTASEVIVRKVY